VPVEEHTITLDREPVFYRSAQWSGVPIVYLHGIPTSSEDWTAFLERTGGIAPDLPGFGRSTKGGHLDYTLQAHAGFIERLLAQLGLEQVRLVAHDWGAGGGLILAQHDPTRVERLVLLDALPLLEGFRWHRDGRMLRGRGIGELIMGSLSRRSLGRWLQRGAATPGAWSDAAIGAVWEQFDQGTQRAILRLFRSADPARLQAAGASLESLQMPALVIHGESDPWYPAAFADAYGTKLADARVERIADAGHWPWLDQPDVIDRVTAFLR